MNKKVFIFIILIFFMSLFNNNLVSSSEVVEINLKNTFELMQKNDLDFKIIKIELDNLKLEIKEDKINNILINSNTEKQKIELNFERTKNNYLNKKNSRIIFAAEKYFNLLELEAEKSIKKKEIVYEKDLLESIKAEEERGYKNKIDVFNQENKLNNSIINSNNIESDYRQELKEFKILLGIEEEKNIELNSKINYKINDKLNKINYKNITKNKEELKLILKEAEIMENELKRLKVIESSQMKINMTKNKLEIKKLEKEKLTQKLTSELKKQHYLCKKAIDNLKMRKNNFTTIKENHSILNQQYKKGMVKKVDLLNSELNVLKEKASLEKAVYNYYLNLYKLKNLLGENLGVDLDV